MQIVFSEDNLHEMSKPIFWKIYENITNLSSAGFDQRVVMVNLIN